MAGFPDGRTHEETASKTKNLPIPHTEPEGFGSSPSVLFPSKSQSEFPFLGRLPGFRVIAEPSAFPSRTSGTVAFKIEGPTRRLQWRDRGRFSRPFLLSPLARGATGTQIFKEQLTELNLALSVARRQQDSMVRVVGQRPLSKPATCLYAFYTISARVRSAHARFATFRRRGQTRGCRGHGWRAGDALPQAPPSRQTWPPPYRQTPGLAV
jgi:hypothetical protein